MLPVNVILKPGWSRLQKKKKKEFFLFSAKRMDGGGGRREIEGEREGGRERETHT